MRLAYFSNSSIASKQANAVHVVNQCEELSEFCDVTLFTRDSFSVSRATIQQDYGVVGNFKVYSFGSTFGRFTFHIFGLLCALIARSRGIKFAYARDIYSAFYATLIGIKCIYEFHSVPKPNSKLKRIILNKTISSPHLIGVTAITGMLRDDLIEKFPDIKFLKVLPDAAKNPHTIKSKENKSVLKLPRYSDSVNIGYVGSLYVGKGIELIVKLAPLCPNFGFHIVGGTKEEIDKWQAEYNGDNIHFYGKVSPSEVGSFISSFDIVLAPNQKVVRAVGGEDIGRWTSPLKLFEYMSYKKAIICSDLPVLREVMIDGKNCVLAQADCADDWRLKIQELISNQALRDSIENRAYEDFLNGFSWSYRAKSIFHLFKSI